MVGATTTTSLIIWSLWIFTGETSGVTLGLVPDVGRAPLSLDDIMLADVTTLHHITSLHVSDRFSLSCLLSTTHRQEKIFFVMVPRLGRKDLNVCNGLLEVQFRQQLAVAVSGSVTAQTELSLLRQCDTTTTASLSLHSNSTHTTPWRKLDFTNANVK